MLRRRFQKGVHVDHIVQSIRIFQVLEGVAVHDIHISAAANTEVFIRDLHDHGIDLDDVDLRFGSKCVRK